MRLTENEKKTLKLLLGNPRMPDTEIASKLSISGVAVGKIRKKLESSVIDSYALNLNYAELGIRIFAIAVAKSTNGGLERELETEQKLLKNPHIINVYRILKGSSTHIILYGFQDMTELDNFFHSPKIKQELHSFIETQELFVFSHNSLLKSSPVQLFHKVIDNLALKSSKVNFSEKKE